MPRRLEDWSLSDHLRFLVGASIWLIGAAAVAGGLSWWTARGLTVTTGDALLQLGHNPVSGWLEPPNELVARMSAPGFLEAETEDRPPGPLPELSAAQLPNSGFVRVRGTSTDPQMMRWAMARAVDKVVREHQARAALSATAIERRKALLDEDIERLKAALALPFDASPELVTERLRLVRRLGRVLRERDDFEPGAKIASPPATRLVQPIAYAIHARGAKQAIYGGVAGLLLALTLLYLREGLRSGAGAAPSSIEKT